MTSFYNLLKYAKTGIASPGMTAYDKMRALSMAGGGAIKTLTGVPPLSFKANGKPLISWSMLGNSRQDGTLTPDAPIMPTFCGKLVGTDWTIPITCARQTVPVYLGQTQTVRKIQKLVLDGTEEWMFYSDALGAWQFYINNISLGGVPMSSCVSNIAPYGVTAITRQRYDYGCYLVTAGNGVAFQMDGAKGTFVGTTSWKSYLAAQYAAGTPVTVWYVLATPETAIANEPLAKIGTYSDELHSADAGVSIPTANGSNTLTVDTELQPSEMTIAFKS